MSGAVDSKLQDKSFEVFYNDMVCKATSPDQVDFARNCIEQHLMGTMRKTIREKCLSKMNQFFRDMKHRDAAMISQVPVPSMVLDCILDEHFSDKLSLDIPFPSYESFQILLSVISHRCPQLEKLTINFFGTGTVPSTPEPVRHSQNPLQYLTELNLFNQPQANQVHLDSINAPLYAVNEAHRSIFSVVGKFCPVLSDLVVRHFCLRKMDVIKLVVKGELADNLFFPTRDDDDGGWSNDALLSGLRVPAAEFLNQLCFTLKKLEVQSECLNSFCLCYDHLASFPEPVMAFALRHLTKLTYLESDFRCIAQAVKELYKATKMPAVPRMAVQAAFERDCREAAHRTGIECSASSHLLLPEFLSLTELGLFPIVDEATFMAIGALCPRLKKVFFCPFESGLDFLDPQSVITPEKLKAALKDWPQVSEIALVDVSPSFMKPLLGNLSAQLEKLVLLNCDQLDMTALMPCVQLKNLSLANCPLNSDVNPPTGLNSQNFLRNLHGFRANHCLQTWAPLFEGKRETLKMLKISCCHIGTNANLDSEWSQVPGLWPQLEHLDVGQCTRLSMTMVAEMISRMSHLVTFSLPESLTANEPELVKNINKDKDVIFNFLPMNGNTMNPCFFQS